MWLIYYFFLRLQPLSNLLVPDDTIHLSHSPHSFGTRGILILDIAIASYSTTRFSILFLYFILQVKPRLETSERAPSPHQTAGNVGNGKPLRLASSRARKGSYRKIPAVDPTESNTGIFILPFSSLCFRQVCHLNFTDRYPMAPTACTRCRRRRAAIPNAQPRSTSVLWTSGIAGDSGWRRPSGGGARGLWSDAADWDEDIVGGVFTQSPRLQRDLLSGADVQLWERSGRRWAGYEKEACWVGDWVHVLPQAEHGNLQDHQRTHPDATCQWIPTSLDAGAPAWPRGGPAALQGPHFPWGPEHGNRWIKETTEPTNGGPPFRVRSHRPGPPLPPVQ